MKGVVFNFRNKQKTIRLPNLRRSAGSVKSYISRYGLQATFAALFMIGLAVGAAYSRGFDTSLISKLDLLFVSNIDTRLGMSAFEIFVSCFASYFLFVFAAFLCALSAWGFCGVPLLSVFKGFSVGLSSALIFSLYKLSGIGFYILVVLPGTVMFLLTLITYCANAFRLSLRYAGLSLFGYDREPALKAKIKYFLKRSLFAFLSAGGCAVLDMLLWVLFANQFDF